MFALYPLIFTQSRFTELGGRQYIPGTGTEAYRITASFGHLAPLVYMSVRNSVELVHEMRLLTCA